MPTTRSDIAPVDPVKLDRLAEVAIKVGLQLQPGQDLFLTAPVAALPLVRRIAVHAYKAGAGLVTTQLSDEELTLARYRNAADASFDRAAGWLFEGMAKAFANNTARLAIVGDNPMLLAGEDAAKVSRASKAQSVAYQPALEKITGFDINWNIVAYPGPSWAKLVFPDDTEDAAVGKLADAIFAASRVDTADPIAAWAKHNAALQDAHRVAQRPTLRRTPFHRPRHRSRPSAWPTVTNGRAAHRRPRTASPAIPISRPRKSSRRRTRAASAATSRAPSRSPIRAR